MILIRSRYVIFAALFILIAGIAGAQSSAGVARFMRTTDPSFDVYTDNPSLSVQQWLQQHFWRMLVYSPYFDTRTSWYPSGYVYFDSYAIYMGSALATQHPEWILKDASGNKLYIPWGCSNGTCPQYAADTSNPNYRQYWINQAAPILAHGYKGLFVDDVNMNFTISDGSSNFVDPIDPNTGAGMTWDNWRNYMAGFTEQIRSAFPATEIVHNSVWYAGPAGVRDQDPYIQRQIAAANYQFIEFGVNDGGLTGGTGIWSLNSLLGYIDRLHAANKGAIISGVAADPAGRKYALANYFLVSAGMDGLGNTVATPDNWWTGFDVNLGSPLGARTVWNNLLRRDYTGGMVLVNPPQSATITVNLPGTYNRVDGTSVTSITLGASQGAVLLLSATPPPDTTPPVVSITSPSNGATVSGSVNVTASASDNVGVTAVDFLVDNSRQLTATTAPYSFAWNTAGFSNAQHTLTAVAHDAAGNAGTSAPLVVTVSNYTPPPPAPLTVKITSADASTVARGPVQLGAQASGAVSVAFYLNGVWLGSAVGSGPSYSVWCNLSSWGHGWYSMTAIATNAAGNTLTSSPVHIKLQ
jgi:hypothetical protein